MSKKVQIKSTLLIGMLLLAAFSRIIPHPMNFAPIGAMGLFGAAYFSRKWLAVLLPLVTLWLSDLVINNVVMAGYYNQFTWFYEGWYWVYGTTALITLTGFFTLRKVEFSSVIGSSLLASVIFFLVTNFACWPGNPMYSQDFSGLLACYAAGIPFFQGTLAGNIFYGIVLFGGYELANAKISFLKSA
jgi:hypothetical protein